MLQIKYIYCIICKFLSWPYRYKSVHVRLLWVPFGAGATLFHFRVLNAVVAKSKFIVVIRQVEITLIFQVSYNPVKRPTYDAMYTKHAQSMKLKYETRVSKVRNVHVRVQS